ncbi:MAG: hypothetical protein AAFP22_07605 [Planctomycetota bacterium]
MSGLLYLAWRHAVARRWRVLLVTLCVTLSLWVPWTAARLAARYDRSLRARAEATPLVVGAPGNRFDLTLSALYFRENALDPITYRDFERVEEEGLALSIPLHQRYTARRKPIVATSPEYYEFRRIGCAEGRLPLRLGECAVGAAVAEELGLGPGDALHSDPTELYDIARPPALKMRVSGVLAPTGGPDDDAVFCDVRTAWILEGIAHGHGEREDLDEELVVGEANGTVAYSGALIAFAEVTPENEASFHYHGDSEGLPLTAVICVPPDEKSRTLLKSEINARDLALCVSPAEVIDDLLGVVFKIKRFFDLVGGFFVATTAALVALVFLLATRLRAGELRTLDRLGAPRSAARALVGVEVLAVTAMAVLLAGLASELTVRWLPNLVAAF